MSRFLATLWPAVLIRVLQIRWFWRLRTLRNALLLRLTWTRFRFWRGVRERFAEVGVVFAALRGALIGVLAAAALAAAVTVAADYLTTAGSALPFAGHVTESPGEFYRDLLTLVPTIAGIVLGLYFTGLFEVVQSRYGTLPDQLRSLVTGDRTGRAYVGVLALAVGFPSFLILAHAAGAVPTRLHAYALGLVGIVAFYSFASAGRTALDFYNPTRLTATVYDQFVSTVRRATIGGYRYRMPEYQVLYRRQADALLEAIDAIFTVAESEPQLRRDALRQMADLIPRLLSWYLTQKSLIPPESQWFPRVAQHRRWYLAEHSVLDVATSARVGLPHQEAVDRNWVENRLLERVGRPITSRAKEMDWLTVVVLLDAASDCVRVLGQHWMIGYARGWYEPIAATVTQSAQNASDAGEDAARYLVGAIDRLGLLPISLLIGFRRRVDALPAAGWVAEVSRADWSRQAEIHRLPSAFLLSEVLGRLGHQLAFERSVYGTQLSPAWFIAEELALYTVEALQRSYAALVELGSSAWAIPSRKAGDPLNSRSRAAVRSRSAEYVTKLQAAFSGVASLREALRETDLSKDYKWPAWDAAAEQARITSAARQRMQELAELIPDLIGVPFDDQLPDYFGQAVSMTGEECFWSLVAADYERFQRLYPLYFIGTLMAAEEVRSALALQQSDSQRIATFFADSLLDLLAISGYALVYGILQKNFRAWELVKRQWDGLLTGIEGDARREKVEAAFEYHRTLFAITPRSVMRTRWEMRLSDDLRRIPRREVGPLPGLDIPDHPNTLIRVLAQGPLGSMFHGEQIFMTCHLRRGRAATPGQVDHLREALDHRRGREA